MIQYSTQPSSGAPPIGTVVGLPGSQYQLGNIGNATVVELPTGGYQVTGYGGYVNVPSPATPAPVAAPPVVAPVAPSPIMAPAPVVQTPAPVVMPAVPIVAAQSPQRQPQPGDYPVIDGFLYDTSLKCDLGFLPLALDQFNALRRAKAYGQRIITVPEDPGHTAIPNRNVFSYGTWVKPQSAFWGYSFIGPTLGLFSVNIHDNCSDEFLFSEVLLNTGDPTQQIPLGKLLVVGAPGLLHVEICSLAGTDMTGVQFILWGGEPRF